jgi:acetyl esterase/lipase
MKSGLLSIALCVALTVHAQKVIPLYQGTAPGSENWNWQEHSVRLDSNTYVFDVSKPSLLAYLPSHPNGTALIIAPGGAFHALALDQEGSKVAQHLNTKGITVFILKYRLVHDDPAHPEDALMKVMQRNDLKKLDSIYARIIPLAMQDGLTAVKMLRQHAANYHIDTNKIGFMGFSAGGTVAMSVIYNATDENRPNFVAPIYAYAAGAIGNTVPTSHTPLFVAVASDDDFGFTAQDIQIYLKWLEAKQPAELHVYEKGGHGFGMKKQHLPVDSWMERFEDWLKFHGYLGK